MKKILVSFIFGALVSSAGFIGNSIYKKSEADTKNKELMSLLSTVHMLAEGARVETGSYPATLREIGFQPAGKIDVILKYCSQGGSFLVSAIHKDTGFAMTLYSDDISKKIMKLETDCEGDFVGI